MYTRCITTPVHSRKERDNYTILLFDTADWTNEINNTVREVCTKGPEHAKTLLG